ncbi:ATP-binding protein [Candidatus Margulisiibacteriota bacterium]
MRKRKLEFNLILISLTVILLLVFSANTFAEDKITPKAIKGVIDLKGWDFKTDGIVNLEGEWEFYWQKELGPNDFRRKEQKVEPAYVKVPSIWKNYKIQAKIASNGYATFRLKILIDNSSNNLAINVNRVLTAYSLTVNGKKYNNPSKFGTTLKTSVPYEYPRIYNRISSNRGEIEIIIKVSNFHRWRGGISDKVTLGLIEDINLASKEVISLNVFLFGSILIISLYHFALFFFQRKEYSFLYFALLSLVSGITQIINDGKYLVMLFPKISWELIVKMDFIAAWLFGFLILLYISTTFPKDTSKYFLRICFVFAIFMSFLVTVTPAKIYSQSMNPLSLYLSIIFIYLVYVIIKVIRNKRDNGYIFAIGFTLLAATSLNDFLYTMRIITNTFVMFPLGIFLFFFSQSYLLAKRYTDTFIKATVLSKDLQELNQGLEQKVEVRTKELKKAKELAEQANHYKTSFLAHMTHDLRTPLHVVIGILDMFSNNPNVKKDKDLDTPVDIALKSGERQLKLVNSILDVGKIESGRIEVRSEAFEFNELFTGLNNEMETLLRNKAVDFIIENKIADKNLIIKSDKLKLEQILTNLLGNAAKFTERGDIHLLISIDKNTLLFEISDTGIGMSPKNAGRVFESYTMIESKIQSRVQGSGLGLTISKGFVEALGGEIWVESELGKGSAFKFWIPLIKGDREKIHKEVKLEEIDLGFLKKQKVLLVDDDKFNCMFAEMVLKNHTQYKIYERGRDVVDILKKEHFDILLTDYHMPEMDGLEVLTEVRRFNKEIPIVVLTASAMKGTKQSFLNKGFSDYFTKPFKEKELLLFLQKKLKGAAK